MNLWPMKSKHSQQPYIVYYQVLYIFRYLEWGRVVEITQVPHVLLWDTWRENETQMGWTFTKAENISIFFTYLFGSCDMKFFICYWIRHFGNIQGGQATGRRIVGVLTGVWCQLGHYVTSGKKTNMALDCYRNNGNSTVMYTMVWWCTQCWGCFYFSPASPQRSGSYRRREWRILNPYRGRKTYICNIYNCAMYQ